MAVILITPFLEEGGGYAFRTFQGEIMSRVTVLASLALRSIILLSLIGAAESLAGGVCEGTQYGIRYRIRCWNDGTCIGSALHPNGRITQAMLSREEAELACSQLL